MNYIYTMIISYLLGSISSAYFIGRFKKVDVKKVGTNNAGASNVFMNVGKKWGIVVFLFDAFKAWVAIFISTTLFKDAHIAELAGFSAVMGHVFPFYMHFNGGKGLSCLIGTGLTLLIPVAPLFTAIYAVALIVFTMLTNYIVCLTMGLSATFPFVYYYFYRDYVGAALFLIILLMMVVKHWENFIRMKNHTEKRLISEVKRKH